MVKVRYEEMLPFEFLEAVKRLPVFIVPLGLLEWHADHLPLGQDALKAHGLCLQLAEALAGGIVLPPIYIGRPGFSSYTGTLTFSEALVHLTISELFSQLKKVGAKVIVLITGHYGPAQLDCVKRAAHVFAAENPDVRVIAQAEYEGVLVDGVQPSDHAGLWETSMFMSMYPELTNMSQLRMVPLEQKIYPCPPNDYYHESATWTWSNDVASANPELGRRAIEAILSHLVRFIKEG